MRKIYRNFITKDEAKELISCYEGEILKSNNDIINRIIEKIKEDFTFSIKKQSNYYIETKPVGHSWHVDTGTNNHMPWCEIGISILLKEPISGGNTYYSDNLQGDNKVKSDRNIHDLISHTSDEWHMIEPHKGKRVVFLMFI